MESDSYPINACSKETLYQKACPGLDPDASRVGIKQSSLHLLTPTQYVTWLLIRDQNLRMPTTHLQLSSGSVSAVLCDLKPVPQPL